MIEKGCASHHLPCGQTAPSADWPHKAQPNHAFGRARPQSLGCDAEAHTLVCTLGTKVTVTLTSEC
jgi:hypothetical protein